MRTADKVCLAVTTLCKIGYLPFAPGTAASIAAVCVFLLIKSKVIFFIFTAVAIFLAYAFCSRAEAIFQEKDSKKIVIDDFCGMLLSLLFVPYDFYLILCSFFLFRMFDMLKFPPANILEQCEGAKGIVGDDIVAGVYANLMLQLALMVKDKMVLS